MAIKQEKPQEDLDLPELEGLITISLAAKILGVSRQAAHGMVKGRQLQGWRIPSAGADRPVVVDKADVQRLKRKRGCKVIEVTIP